MFFQHRTILAGKLLLAVMGASLIFCRTANAEPSGDANGREPASAEIENDVKSAKSSGADAAAAVWRQLAAGNARFVADQERPREFANTRRELARGQHPRAVVLTCADSRLSPELIFDCNLGELFVVRTAGNIADPIVVGSIEYAVAHLHVETVIVLGHEKCGAVIAAASGEAMPSPNLDAIVKKIGPALDSIEPRGTGEAFVRQGIEVNVHFVVADILKHSTVLKEKADEGNLGIIPAIYRLETGKVDLLK